MKYVLYQLSNNSFLRKKLNQESVDLNNYVGVYTEELDAAYCKDYSNIQICEMLALAYNDEPPENFASRACLVSDIIELISDEGETHYYYYDPHNWIDITNRIIK